MGITDWLLKPLGWLFARHPDWRDAFGRMLLWIGHRFYWALAVILALAGAWDLLGHPFDNQLAHESFDLLMRQRPMPIRRIPTSSSWTSTRPAWLPCAQYGRWPWPREVLGEVAAKMERGGARAVMFDILFSDEDVANPAQRGRFDKYVLPAASHFSPRCGSIPPTTREPGHGVDAQVRGARSGLPAS